MRFYFCCHTLIQKTRCYQFLSTCNIFMLLQRWVSSCHVVFFSLLLCSLSYTCTDCPQDLWSEECNSIGKELITSLSPWHRPGFTGTADVTIWQKWSSAIHQAKNYFLYTNDYPQDYSQETPPPANSSRSWVSQCQCNQQNWAPVSYFINF